MVISRLAADQEGAVPATDEGMCGWPSDAYFLDRAVGDGRADLERLDREASDRQAGDNRW